MKRVYLSAFSFIAVAGTLMADITVNVNPSVSTSEFDVRNRYISDMLKPRMDRPEPITGTARVINGKFVLPTMKDSDAETTINTGDNESIVIYTRPGDQLVVNLESISPLSYTISGTPLMEDISSLDMQVSALMQQVQSDMENGMAEAEAAEKYDRGVAKIYTNFIDTNPNSEAAAFALLQLEGQDFLNAFAKLSETAKKSPVAPLIQSQKERVERNIAYEKRLAELQSGNIDAPNFTFKNAEGKEISLSDFRGKWVVIDFWGTWCPWCIKGFPALKEAYSELRPKLEILGVACNDKYEAWEKGVKRFELPWVNVYNPVKGGGQVLEDYAVEGFPTKVIVNPEGKIANITVGENPAFFDILREMVK